MPLSAPSHPVPAAGLPSDLDPRSAVSVQRFVRKHSFPCCRDGRWLFALAEEAVDGDFQRVRLHHGLAGHRHPVAMRKCPDGVHVIELHATLVRRIEYRFGLIDGEGNERLIVDPVNPNTVRDPFAVKSVGLAPDYAPPAEAQPAPEHARGELEEMSVPGPLGHDRSWRTWIWHPPAHPRSSPLPVVLFLDGRDYLEFAAAREILEQLTHLGRIRPCRAIFLKPAERNAEYAANPRTAAALVDAIPRALASHIPWPQQPRDRIAVGASLGGLCLLQAQLTQPAAGPFGRLILQSGAFFQPHTDDMERSFPHFQRICSFVSSVHAGVDERTQRIGIHLTCGSGEENIINNCAMAATLRTHGFPITFTEQPDAHNWTCWRDSLVDALRVALS